MLSRIFKIAAGFALFATVVGISAYLTLTLIIQSEDTVVVPELTGRDVVYVLEILTDLGLNTKVKGSEYSAGVPKNQVILQEPSAGTEIKKGRDVRIILSKGPQVVVMPTLLGLSIQQARILLEENGLCEGYATRIHSARVDREAIVAHTPPPGAAVARGQCVDLLESLGPRPQTMVMSDFKGRAIDETILEIESAKLLLGKISSVANSRLPAGAVTDQDPPAGHRVTEGAVVNLTVNRSADGRALSNGLSGSTLFRHRVANGFLKKRVRVRLDSLGISSDLFNDLVRPGDEIWLLIPQTDRATLFLYEDDDLVKVKVF